MVALATSPRVNGSRRHEAQEAQLARYADGSIVALSLSVPGVVYAVTLDPTSCTCPGFQHRGGCYHTAAAAERFGDLVEVAVRAEPPSICGTCATVIDTRLDIPPYGTRPDRPGKVAHWRCADLNACVARRDAGRWS